MAIEVTADLSILSVEDRELAEHYIRNGTQAATHTTKNAGQGLRLPKVDSSIYDIVHSTLVENMSDGE
jgi:hypothetical protein